MPFSKSNNFTHTAHNVTEATLNERENACLDYDKRGDFYCRRNTHTPHTRAPTAPHLTIQTENTTSITSPTQTHNILQHSKALFFNNGRYTTNIPTDPHTVTTTDMRHIHTSIVSRHLATRGNYKIPRTHDTHHLFNCTHVRTTLSPLDLWMDPAGVTALLARWTEKLAGGPQAGRSNSLH